MELYWNQKCDRCGAKYLDSENDSFIKKCGCYNNVVDDLRPLPPIFAEALRQFPNHMSSLSQIYNNILSFGGVGIASKFGGGCQKNFQGRHAATINGRTYHKTHSQSSSNPSGGIGYIFFDNLQKLNEKGEKFDEIKLDLLGDIFNEMKFRNPTAKEVYTLGNY